MAVFADFHPLAAIATTPAAARRLEPCCQTLGATLWLPTPLSGIAEAQVYPGTLKEHLTAHWSDYRGWIFALATGAVVRLIAPLLQDKATDPAVVVLDEAGKFVVSLCSGHLGGADRLSQILARQLGAVSVVTGAAAAANLPAIDLLGTPFGWQRGAGDWTGVSAAIAHAKPVQVIQVAGTPLWQQPLPPDHPFVFDLEIQPQARVWITPESPPLPAHLPTVLWHPRVLWLGIGCERHTPKQVIAAAVQQVCQAHHLAEAAIAGVVTIDLKADEVGLVELCRDRHWPLSLVSAEVLRTVGVPHPSTVVAAAVGTPSVAEAAALTGASRQIGPGPSLPGRLRVPKQVFRLPDQPGAVTLAIAEAAQEYTGRRGQLWLVGIGPGQIDQITPAAQAAVTQADVVIGYGLYIDLVRSLFRPAQMIESLPITQERQRAQRAIALAQWGLTVAVVSSGDAGIYGMAGLVLEELQAGGWDGKTPEIQVFPGVSALQSAASRVGAPLMHDFCAISLSDRLTPWDVIQQRLEAAAQADFVTAFYNPRSQERTQQILQAQEIFLKYRAAETPVALVRSAYRPDEQITLTTLGQLHHQAIDMLTTVLIGNRSTRVFANWMITPRGYSGFYSNPG